MTTPEEIKAVMDALDSPEQHHLERNMLTLFRANARLWREVESLRARMNRIDGLGTFLDWWSSLPEATKPPEEG